LQFICDYCLNRHSVLQFGAFERTLKMNWISRMKHTLIIILILFSVAQSPAQNLDYKILKSVNKTEHPSWDKGMRGVSHSIFIVTPVSIAGILTQGYVQNDDVMIRNGYKSAISIGFTVLLTSGLKYLVNRPRPYITYPTDIIQRSKTGKYSFPSGHTSLAFATATVITLSSRNIYLAIPSYAYAAFVGYSRMRLGVHYTSDILGGMVIGIGSGLLTWQLDKMINGK